jgi:uncharacterized membrane protein YqjE
MVNPRERETAESSLPAVTAGVVESAVTLAKAELRLAIVETRTLLLRVIGALAWVLLAGFALQVAVAMLVLGPLLSTEMSDGSRWSLIVAPCVLAFALCLYAFNTIKRVRHDTSTSRG